MPGLVHIAFALYVIPPKVFPKDGTPAMRLQLCQTDSAVCAPVPVMWPPIWRADVPGLSPEIFLPWRRPGHYWTTDQIDSYAWSWRRLAGTAPVGFPGVGCRQKRPCVIRPAVGS